MNEKAQKSVHDQSPAPTFSFPDVAQVSAKTVCAAVFSLILVDEAESPNRPEDASRFVFALR